MKRYEISDIAFMISLAVLCLYFFTYLNYAFGCVSECTYTGDYTRWRNACYTVARCVDRQEDGSGTCFVASEYFKLETILCDDIISDTFDLNGEEVCKQSKERCGL
jgi:hypothetical protein